MTTDAAVPEIAALIEGRPEVVFAYLFGSSARGDARPDSDVDLAVYLEPPGGLAAEARLQVDLAQALGRDDVDLVVLNHAPLWLQFRIVGEGVVAFSRDEPRRLGHREEVERQFLDFRPYHDAYLAAVRESAREGLSG